MNACPYCSLLCFPNQLGGIEHCSKRKTSLIAKRDAAFECASVQGKTASYSDAIESCVQCLSDATHILITGRINSLETSREALKLARKLDAYVDLMDSSPMFDWIESVQEMGCTTSSISEARYRSDLIVVFQSDLLLTEFPLVLEQLLLHHDRLLPRPKILFINSTSVNLQRVYSDELREQVIESSTLEVADADLYSFLKACTTKATDRVPIDLISKAQLFRSALLTASYPVILFSTSMAVPHQRTIYSLLNQLTADLSTINRIHLLPLQSSSLQFSQACTWQAGFPGRIHFVDGHAIYGPRTFSAIQLSEDYERTLTTVSVEESDSNASILIKGSQAEIRIPVAQAAVEGSSTLMKADGSIMLKIDCESKYKQAAIVLSELSELMKHNHQASL